ncbi:Hypothetical protein MIP_00299 [Mycobacterium intracellulare subsp. intracellulare MTCC 9506]|uniref:Uncharacterized protein n=1 Tax=Mycobacterium indicus pranii (strain DSM 45239 / MTCC 9506) TaxID=1232724 RepID=J9WA79_MYCIP|nr:Hypothetical protein MIP_00299 [Mycobacterium intracellulare subsp. intracellulare MTCC 9506]
MERIMIHDAGRTVLVVTEICRYQAISPAPVAESCTVA